MQKYGFPLIYILFLLAFVGTSCSDTEENQLPNILSLEYEINSYDPFIVDFTAQANDLEDSITFEWDFGDGTVKQGGATIQHTFELGQVYIVILAVSDGNNAPVQKMVEVDADILNVQVRINESDVRQTIQGFGGFGAKSAWWSDGPFYDEEFIDVLINDLGITIFRDEIPISFEPQNENIDANNLELSKFNINQDIAGSDSNMSQHLPYLKALHEAGLEKLIATIWSPPVWMKHNDHRGNGTNDQTSAPDYTTTPDETTNQLQVQYYEELAEYCVAYIQLIKQETGIDLYAISLQNEPRFSQFYASCVHSPESLRDLIKVVGNRFEEEGITTKIFAPEDVQSMWHIRQYLDAILKDEVANKYTDIFAIHNYQNDGVTASDEGPQNWQETYQKAQQGDKEVWMTETSGFDPNTIEGGLSLAKSMFNAIYFGNASAWVYWQMSESNDRGFLANGEPTFLYYSSKHFYRHVRPGMQSIGTTSNDEGLLSLAFQDPDSDKKVLIFINCEPKIFNLTLAGLAEDTKFTVYETNENVKHQQATAPLATQSLSVPPKTIITLVESK